MPVATDLLFQTLRANAEGLSWRPDAVDPDDLAVTAIVLGLAPLLHWRLETWNTTLAARAQVKLAATRQAALAREKAIHAQLAELLTALNARGLTPIVLKGAYLASAVYPAPGLRPMNDIDLLFRPGDLAAAETVLAELGYGAKEKSADAGPGVTKHTRTYRRGGEEARTPNPYLSADTGRTVEPHRSLEESWFGLRVDITPGVWDRSVEVMLAGQRALALSREDNLLHLAVHLTFHLIMGAPSMVQLIDLRFATERWASELNWAKFHRRTLAARAAPFAYAALRLAHETLAAPIPAQVICDLASACSAPLRAQAERLNLADVMRRTQRPPLTRLGQRLKRGLEDRAEAARWAPTLDAKWRVWRTAFAVTRTDTGQIIARRLGLSR
ncbi:MAG: nucleotidyltransferase family protein [Chloroflexi bacterium]|nr:nucleotidyltransferase family protein [Chloroflexota bacterium]